MTNLKQKKLLATIIFSISIIFFALPIPSRAAGLVPCGGYSTASQNPCTVSDIFVLIAKATNFLIAAAALVAVYEFINHGFYLIVSLGNEEAIASHKKAISGAVVGFVLILMAFMFVNTVVNFLLTRGIVSDKPACKLDLTSPLTYLTIDQNQCNSLPESQLHPGTGN